MTGLVPVIHVVQRRKRFRRSRNGAAWMAGTSPAMTETDEVVAVGGSFRHALPPHTVTGRAAIPWTPNTRR